MTKKPNRNGAMLNPDEPFKRYNILVNNMTVTQKNNLPKPKYCVILSM